MARKTNTVKKTEVEAPVVSTPAVAEARVYPSTEQMIADGLTTKSARIRHLHSLEMPIGDIARQETGGLYQHAYNVIKKPLKKTAAVVPATAEAEAAAVEATKSDETPVAS